MFRDERASCNAVMMPRIRSTRSGAVAEARRMAWDWFAAMPDKIASIMRREWANLPALAQASHNG